MRVGFIGLGHMGRPMVSNLLQQGCQVDVYDIDKQAVQLLVEQGAAPSLSVKQVVQMADVVFTMLQTGDQVKETCLGDDGIFKNIKAQAIYIDCSSIDVNESKQLHESAKNQGIAMVDAPVSGGVAAAEAGSLTFMVGGEKTHFAKVQTVLSYLGQKIIHAGPEGTGAAAKICNNMILGISMIAVCEAFNLAEKLGLDAKKLYEISAHASGQCWALTSYCPAPNVMANVPANSEYKAGFTAQMMLKDLSLSQQAAQQASISTPLGHAATTLYDKFVSQGYGDTDFSGIIRMLD